MAQWNVVYVLVNVIFYAELGVYVYDTLQDHVMALSTIVSVASFPILCFATSLSFCVWMCCSHTIFALTVSEEANVVPKDYGTVM